MLEGGQNSLRAMQSSSAHCISSVKRGPHDSLQSRTSKLVILVLEIVLMPSQ